MQSNKGGKMNVCSFVFHASSVFYPIEQKIYVVSNSEKISYFHTQYQIAIGCARIVSANTFSNFTVSVEVRHLFTRQFIFRVSVFIAEGRVQLELCFSTSSCPRRSLSKASVIGILKRCSLSKHIIDKLFLTFFLKS